MASTAVRVRRPHITARKGYCGGNPVIAGTKFPVRSIVTYVLRQGMTPEELVAEFRHLTLAQVHDALSDYYDHQAEIDADIIDNAETRVRAAHECDGRHPPVRRRGRPAAAFGESSPWEAAPHAERGFAPSRLAAPD